MNEMEFKYYVSYAKLVQPGDLPMKFEKVGKLLKKYKMELVFWGHPFGTAEGIIYLMKGDVKDYENAMMQNDLSEALGFITDTRTHFVIAP